MKLIKYIPRVCSFVFPAMLFCVSKVTANPTVGAHVLAYYSCGSSGGLSTPAITTQASGSTFLAWVGRGDVNQFTTATIPTDNKGNTFVRLGRVHNYSPAYPGSGEELYSCTAAVGGNGHIFTAPMTGVDEITLAVVEIINGGVIQTFQWNSVTSPQTNQTSLNVTTTGAATLVAIWAGDSGANLVTAVPNNGFTTIDSQLLAVCQVEAVVATKNVTAAGTYNVTWTSTPAQGAHLYLVALQSVPAPVLQAQISGSNLAISWPTSADGFGLETNNNLSDTNSWTFVTNSPAIIGSLNVITNQISPGAEFYRLMKP
jgi:hypothetical protein